MKLTAGELEDIIGEVRPYSGRGMFGKQCPCAITQDGQPVLGMLADLIDNCDDTGQAAALLREARTDSMGCETVVYWPSAILPGDAS